MPFPGVGGKGSSLTTVRSASVFPPRGPTIPYWPERGAFSPGTYFLGIIISSLKLLLVTFSSPVLFPGSGLPGYGIKADLRKLNPTFLSF
jgi:hypothetical protein